MELELIEKDKDSIKIRFIDPEMTIINPLVTELLNDKVVAAVDFWAGHPDLEFPTLYVRVEKGKPQTALKRAAKNLSNQFKDAREKLQKELK
ncbi:MAG TPA: RpoL/Rpb11 RNA polymerase subunit family protein [Methanomassiliicoccales archaeon]|nr:RpoL/Rpb11 RNA polymerase subunit family protein [Methanomassiliicoccales archaeon]